MRKGKLKSQVVKVQMLDQWSNKTKNYYLEDLENNKLITLQDVQFFKNDLSNDLAIVYIDVELSEKEEVDNLVDETIRMNQYMNLYHQHVNIGLKSTINVTSISNASNSETSNYYMLPGSSFLIPPISNIQTSHTEPPTPPTVELRPSRQAVLSRRNLSS